MVRRRLGRGEMSPRFYISPPCARGGQQEPWLLVNAVKGGLARRCKAWSGSEWRLLRALTAEPPSRGVTPFTGASSGPGSCARRRGPRAPGVLGVPSVGLEAHEGSGSARREGQDLKVPLVPSDIHSREMKSLIKYYECVDVCKMVYLYTPTLLLYFYSTLYCGVYLQQQGAREPDPRSPK